MITRSSIMWNAKADVTYGPRGGTMRRFRTAMILIASALSAAVLGCSGEAADPKSPQTREGTERPRGPVGVRSVDTRARLPQPGDKEKRPAAGPNAGAEVGAGRFALLVGVTDYPALER